MPDFRHRATTPEWMDGDDVTQAQFAACVADLATVNSITLARPPTLAFVRLALAAMPNDAVPTILDVGFGEGDMLRGIAAMLQRLGRPARLIGIDLNWRSEAVARAATPAGMAIEWRTGDAFEWPGDQAPDLIISSLVTHHMDDAGIVRFLAWMEATARHGWFVNDLHRHPIAWYGFKAMAALARWHPFVRHDGPVSIERSFVHQDWERLLAAAGVANQATVHWRFPFRYCVERRRW